MSHSPTHSSSARCAWLPAQQSTPADIRGTFAFQASGFFIADAEVDTLVTRAALDDPFKQNYGYDRSVGVEDMLWGEYVDWLAEVAPEHVAHHISENWWGQKTHRGTKFGDSPPATRVFHPQVSDFFESHMPAELHPSRFIVDRTCDFIRNNADGPFYAHCSPPPIEPGQFPAPLRGNAERGIKRMHEFPDELWRWARANYYGMISNLDSCVGRLLDTLGDLDIRDNTIIVFVSDHGEFVGGCRFLYKGSLIHDDLMKAPLVFSWPKKIRKGQTVDALVQEIDIYPTLLSMIGVPISTGVQGRDLTDLIDGPSESGYDHVFCELDDLPDQHNIDSVAVRTEEWKLNYFVGTQNGMLFNLFDDPGETHNRFDDPSCAEARQKMMALLADSYHAMKDPLPVRLRGA